MQTMSFSRIVCDCRVLCRRKDCDLDGSEARLACQEVGGEDDVLFKEIRQQVSPLVVYHRSEL